MKGQRIFLRVVPIEFCRFPLGIKTNLIPKLDLYDTKISALRLVHYCNHNKMITH